MKKLSLFELKALSRDTVKCHNGSYSVYEQSLGIFSTVEQAERFMKIILDKEREYTCFFAFFIYEKLLDGNLHNPRHDVCDFYSARTYLPDGTFYAGTACDDTCEKNFRGRPAAAIPLKAGDLAWVWGSRHIYPCQVIRLPMTDLDYVRWCHCHGRDENSPERFFDYSDDSYLVVRAGYGHDHPLVWQTLPFFGSLAPRHRAALDAAIARFERDGC